MNEIRIRIQCAADKDHAKILKLDAAKGAAYARDLAELVCGISPMYIHKPAKLQEATGRNPIGNFGLCQVCGGKLGYTLEELSAPETWEFDGYRLRATNAGDLALAAEWTAADGYHAGLDPAFWLEQGPAKQSYLLFDAHGPVYFFKGVLRATWPPSMPGNALDVYIQFPPEDVIPSVLGLAYHKLRIGKALIKGTEWLAKRMNGVAEEFVFETLSPSLKQFCIKKLDFEERDGKLRKRIGVPVMG